MSDIRIMKAVEFDKLPAAFKKKYSLPHLRDLGYWLQRKYDGCFAAITLDMDLDKCRVESRTGEPVRSMNHIVRELHSTCCEKMLAWDTVVVLGEAWRPPSEALFPEISGQFRRHNAEPSLHFVINDMVHTTMDTRTFYRHRWSDLYELFGGTHTTAFKSYPAETWGSGTWTDDPEEIALRWQGEGGFDGAIMRNPDTGYTVGLVKQGEIIKVKPTLSLDLRVIDAKTEPGAKTGRAVVTLCVEYKGKTSWVGSGVPHDMKTGDACGQIAEIECLGVTADGKLREPRFKGIRFDKEHPDE